MTDLWLSGVFFKL